MKAYQGVIVHTSVSAFRRQRHEDLWELGVQVILVYTVCSRIVRAALKELSQSR